MIDVKRLRADPEYRRGIERKRVAPGVIDELLAADDARRALVTEVDEMRARQNAASKEIGKAAPEERQAKIDAAARLKEELAQREDARRAAEERVAELAVRVPNPADGSVPEGGEDEGVVLREVGGELPGPPPLDHADFGDRMGFTEREQAAEMSGSRFAYLMREAVLLELALVSWTMRMLVAEGFTPVVPPVLVREQMMQDAGFFPTDRAQVYELGNDDLFLVGTAEVPLAGIHRGQLLDAADLPARYAGFSPCFRREAGTAGKDTRGVFRVHQFDKVEMFVYADPSRSWEEHERILALEERIVGELGLPYRVVNIAAGDLGAPAAKKYDIEVWLPSEGRYRELTSCSNYLDYSARRLSTRVRGEQGNELVHTLNGTACAVSRTLVFLMEHYQQPDGSMRVPDVLLPYCGFDTIAPRV